MVEENVQSAGRRIYHTSKNYMFKYFLLFVWIILVLFLFCKGFHTYYHEPEFYYLRNILGLGLCIGRGTALIINLIVVLIILPVCKTFNKFVHLVLSRISVNLLAAYLEKLKVFHQCLAVTLVFVSAIHSLTHFANILSFIRNYDSKYPEINWAKDEKDNLFRLLFFTPTGFSGVTMLASLGIIWSFSTRQMRNYFYNSFLGVHHLFLLFFVMMYFHPLSNIIKYQENIDVRPPFCDFIDPSELLNSTKLDCTQNAVFTAGKKHSYIWPSIAITIYLLDVNFRYFKRLFKRLKLLEMELSTKNCVTLRFKLNDFVQIEPGQYILLQCENLSKLEWHPFTVIDCIHQQRRTIITLAILVRGDWTFELYRKISDFKKLSHKRRRRSIKRRTVPRKLKFILDGPFNSPLESAIHKHTLVLIAAGIGITPFISIFNYLLKSTKKSPINRIHLVWISKDLEQFAMFCQTLCDLDEKFWDENQPDKFQMRFYLTSTQIQMDDEESLHGDELFGKHALFINSRLYDGRPSWPFLFEFWGSLYRKQTISCYCCGPKSLTKEVKNYCRKTTKNGNNFTFLHEAFS